MKHRTASLHADKYCIYFSFGSPNSFSPLQLQCLYTSYCLISSISRLLSSCQNVRYSRNTLVSCHHQLNSSDSLMVPFIIIFLFYFQEPKTCTKIHTHSFSSERPPLSIFLLLMPFLYLSICNGFTILKGNAKGVDAAPSSKPNS